MNDSKVLKPHLRFEVGDLVFFKSDLERLYPLVVTAVFEMDDKHDYVTVGVPKRKNREAETYYVSDKVLIGEEKEAKN